MPQPDETIRLLLETRLHAMPGRPAVAWENRDFTPPSGAIYIRPTLQSGAQDIRTILPGNLGHAVSETGLFLVDVFCPQGAGTAPGGQVAEAVRARFAPGLSLSAEGVFVRVLGCARDAGRQDEASARWMIPITVRFRADYRAPAPV